MKQKLESLNAYIDSLAYPNRIMVLILVCVIVFVLWYVILRMPQSRTYSKRFAQFSTMQAEITNMNAERDLIVALAQGGSDQKEKKDLESQIAKADQNLEIYQGEMVPFDRLSSLVREVLDQQSGLSLLGLHTTGIQNLVTSKDLFSNGSSKLLQQGIEIELNGNYQDFLSYLDRLESLSYRFFWDGLDYKVTEYPNATISVHMYTIGY